MPRILESPADHGGPVPKLLTQDEARKFLRASWNKWYLVKPQIDATFIGDREFYTPQALAKFIKSQTRRGVSATA